MEMELISLLQVLWRRLWLIISVMLVTGLVLWVRLRAAEPVYMAQVELQLSAPQREDVPVFNEYSFISLRDEMTVARNNLTAVLKSREVYSRTINRLALPARDAIYSVDVNSVRDADFVHVAIEAQTPELAADIANAHVDIAIAYYGELRAKPTSAEKQLFAEQLRIAEEEFRVAEDAFTEYKAEHGVTSLEHELATVQSLLEQLQLERDRRMLEESANPADLVGEVDELIAQRQTEFDRLAALQPMYNLLEGDSQVAYEKYQHVMDKYIEAELKANTVQAANFIQIVEPAQPPARPVSSFKKLLALAIAGSLGFGVLLAFLLEYISDLADDGLEIDDTETQSVMGLPLLGTVPRMARGRCESHSQEAETIRQLRTQVLLSSPGDHLQTLLVTSPQPKDGKTVVTANLGEATAGGGASVVVVDADLRAPELHEWFDQPNLTGLADLLQTDKAMLEQLLPQVLCDTHVPGLSLLSAGQLPLDPSPLLASPNMVALLKLLSDRFDLVLFDSPPTASAPDATILAMLTQETLLVFSPDTTTRRAARQAIGTLKSRDDVRIIGVALNRTSLGYCAYRHYVHRETLPQKLGKAVLALPVIGRPADLNLVSVSQAATMLGVHIDTIKRWCETGRLPAVKKRLRWWVRRDELQGMLLDRLPAGLPSSGLLADDFDGRSMSKSLRGATAAGLTKETADSEPFETSSPAPTEEKEGEPPPAEPQEGSRAAGRSAPAGAQTR